jgi:hypothetical protein
MRQFFFTLLLLASTSAYSSTVTIDFSGATEGGIGLGATVSEPNGFTFTNTGAFILCTGDSICPLPRGETLGLFGAGGSMTVDMEQDDGTAFDLLQLDVLYEFGFCQFGECYEETVQFAAYDQFDVLIAQKTANRNDGPTVTFDSGWQNIHRLVFTTQEPLTGNPESLGGLDNIQVSVVPVPAAVWLFGSALAGLAWLRRKQTV